MEQGIFTLLGAMVGFMGAYLMTSKASKDARERLRKEFLERQLDRTRDLFEEMSSFFYDAPSESGVRVVLQPKDLLQMYSKVALIEKEMRRKMITFNDESLSRDERNKAASELLNLMRNHLKKLEDEILS